MQAEPDGPVHNRAGPDHPRVTPPRSRTQECRWRRAPRRGATAGVPRASKMGFARALIHLNLYGFWLHLGRVHRAELEGERLIIRKPVRLCREFFADKKRYEVGRFRRVRPPCDPGRTRSPRSGDLPRSSASACAGLTPQADKMLGRRLPILAVRRVTAPAFFDSPPLCCRPRSSHTASRSFDQTVGKTTMRECTQETSEVLSIGNDIGQKHCLGKLLADACRSANERRPCPAKGRGL